MAATTTMAVVASKLNCLDEALMVATYPQYTGWKHDYGDVSWVAIHNHDFT